TVPGAERRPTRAITAPQPQPRATASDKYAAVAVMLRASGIVTATANTVIASNATRMTFWPPKWSLSHPPTGREVVAKNTNPAARAAASVSDKSYVVFSSIGRYTPKATKAPKVSAYSSDKSQVVRCVAAFQKILSAEPCGFGRS